MRISLRLKLILSQTLPILVILTLFGFYLVFVVREYTIDQLREDMLRTGELLEAALQTDPALAENTGNMQALLRRADVQTSTRIQLIDRNGNIFASTEAVDAPLIGTVSQEKAVKSALAGKISYETSKNDVATVALPIISAGQIGAIRLSIQMSDIQAMLNRLYGLVILSVLVLTVLSLALVIYISSTVSRPIQQLSQEIKSVADGDYSGRVKAPGDIDVANLARHFNAMVDRLEEQRATRQQLLGDISHELRRPISAVRTAIETIQNASPGSSEAIHTLQTALIREMDRLGRLTNRLDFAAREGENPDPSSREPVDVAATLKAVLLLFKPEAQRLGIRLAIEIPDDLPAILGGNDALVEIFTNLIDNALKFTPTGGVVSVSAGVTADKLWIQIGDSGMGLTQEEQQQLFKRFYRGDPTRPRPHGVGLGLAITHELVQACGGTIRVSSEPDRGSTFIVEFPH